MLQPPTRTGWYCCNTVAGGAKQAFRLTPRLVHKTQTWATNTNMGHQQYNNPENFGFRAQQASQHAPGGGVLRPCGPLSHGSNPPAGCLSGR